MREIKTNEQGGILLPKKRPLISIAWNGGEGAESYSDVAYLQIQQDDDKTVTEAKWEEVKGIYCGIVYKYVYKKHSTLGGGGETERESIYHPCFKI